jgi:hypothetical protein
VSSREACCYDIEVFAAISVNFVVRKSCSLVMRTPSTAGGKETLRHTCAAIFHLKSGLIIVIERDSSPVFFVCVHSRVSKRTHEATIKNYVLVDSVQNGRLVLPVLGSFFISGNQCRDFQPRESLLVVMPVLVFGNNVDHKTAGIRATVLRTVHDIVSMQTTAYTC